eukprot:COSAG04_NODE_1255_length_7540_cov_2.717108_3_plen_68_part_00
MRVAAPDVGQVELLAVLSLLERRLRGAVHEVQHHSCRLEHPFQHPSALFRVRLWLRLGLRLRLRLRI